MDFNELQGLWYYYLSIEKDLYDASRYIEPNGQEEVYSFEYSKIIVLSCAEIEAAFKKLCEMIDPSKKCGNIGQYKEIILGKYPKICEALVVVPRWAGKNIFPFSNWEYGNLLWWDVYTDLKHNRIAALHKASYKNAVYALAALYLTILYLYKISGFDCKADESMYLESNYCPEPLYCKGPSALPDFE